ncbi:MAG TPA: hypothetical protein PKL31_17670, partial [Fulvivirga sp.]|nr:hypothetical protein [Fulvivirga sp.]
KAIITNANMVQQSICESAFYKAIPFIPFILRFEFLALSAGLPWSYCDLRPQADEGLQRAEKVLRQGRCN